jgi:hypothetical protein
VCGKFQLIFFLVRDQGLSKLLSAIQLDFSCQGPDTFSFFFIPLPHTSNELRAATAAAATTTNFAICFRPNVNQLSLTSPTTATKSIADCNSILG